MAYQILNNDNKFIYVHIPKTGGTTIQQVLNNDSNSVCNNLLGHVSLKSIKKVLDEDDYNEHISFTTVRNPWDLYVSNYHYLKQQNHNDSDFKKEYKILESDSFTDFIKFIHDNRDSLIFNDEDKTPKWQQLLEWSFDGKKHVDYFIKLEELSEKKLREVGLNISYTHTKTNVSQHDHYSVYYNNETIDMVRDMHKDDIKYFNYKFETK
jgi:hypothetical protein|tara:strand:- start:752 stop:1378 length:627 start_codon:yes stop_codon:yes gene_type:complete